jgi:hypothetical protein
VEYGKGGAGNVTAVGVNGGGGGNTSAGGAGVFIVRVRTN